MVKVKIEQRMCDVLLQGSIYITIVIKKDAADLTAASPTA